jgi:hypothetical protein
MDTQGPLTEGLTLKQAAQQVGCSDALIRKIVKREGFPVTKEDAPRGGFRYLIRAADMPALAHKVSMRRYGRKAGEAIRDEPLPTSYAEGLTTSSREAISVGLGSVERDELIRLRERALMLEQENVRLWRQMERLTETVSQLALPPAREPGLSAESESEAESVVMIEAPVSSGGGEEGKIAKRSFWDWFFGRDRGGGEGARQSDSG